MFSAQMTHIALHVENIEACVNFYRGYCGLEVIHQRKKSRSHVVWMAESNQNLQWVLVILSGGNKRIEQSRDYGHLGFAMNSREQVDALAYKAKKEGILIWPPVNEPFPVGYYCGVVDPNGNYVEFSYGQPLGAGAEMFEFERLIDNVSK